MHVEITKDAPTKVRLTIKGSSEELSKYKDIALRRLSKNLKVPGFRQGKAPHAVVEKHIDQNVLQGEFLEEALGQLYAKAAQDQGLRPVDRPEVSLKKFVPYSVLEFEAAVETVSDIKLPDYKKIKKQRQTVKVTESDVDKVIESLRNRAADRREVDRSAKEGDQVVIDFSGKDTEGQPVQGAEGKDYPLLLGSDAFIPGFEKHLIGMKAGEDKSFTLTFPKDYGARILQGKKVMFTVTVNKVLEVTEPKVDDAFAMKVSPFKTLGELRADIKRQVIAERENQARTDLENAILADIISKTKVELPKRLIDEQVDRLMQEVRQNLTYQGLTLKEYLENEGKTEQQFRNDSLLPQAIERLKGGLALSEIAERESVTVTPEELEVRMQLLSGQYQDKAMQAELQKPEARREIASRMTTEKTMDLLVQFAETNKK